MADVRKAHRSLSFNSDTPDSENQSIHLSNNHAARYRDTGPTEALWKDRFPLSPGKRRHTFFFLRLEECAGFVKATCSEVSTNLKLGSESRCNTGWSSRKPNRIMLTRVMQCIKLMSFSYSARVCVGERMSTLIS